LPEDMEAGASVCLPFRIRAISGCEEAVEDVAGKDY